MYICGICDSIFEKPKTVGACSERLGYEIEYYCPCCGSNAVEEAIICEACENACKEDKTRYIEVTNKYDETLKGYICDDCLYQALEEYL
jgi:hypothetical protein